MKDTTKARETAAHEAGHAVVAHLLGIPIDKVTVVRHGRMLGHVMYGQVDAIPREDLVIASMAGRLAQRFADVSAGHLTTTDDSGDREGERKLAVEIAKQRGSSGQGALQEVMSRAGYKAEQLVDQHEATIRKVAAELCSRKTMTGAELRSLIGGGTDGQRSGRDRMRASDGILPWENLYRAVGSVPKLGGSRSAVRATGEGDGRTLEVRWYVADTWTEIDSWYEGNFMERVAPGAAAKWIANNRADMRILLQHGQDPSVGQKPIAPIDFVGEDDAGGFGGGRLFDGLDPLVADGLRGGQYGASFRFSVLIDEYVQEPGQSDHNPRGIPERTIKEMRVPEFGPVTWGAYSSASSAVRSITDDVLLGGLRNIPRDRLTELLGSDSELLAKMARR